MDISTLEDLQKILTPSGIYQNPAGTIVGIPSRKTAPIVVVSEPLPKPVIVTAPGVQSTQSGNSVPAPTINQSLVGTPTGYQFSFNQSVLAPFSTQIIQCYNVYRGQLNSFASASLIQVIPANPHLLGGIVVTDSINVAGGFQYFYWVLAVDSNGNTSAPVAAQTGVVSGSVGSLPPSLSTPFKLTTTTTSVTITTSPSCFFTRADGTITKIGQTSQACTGLPTGNTVLFFPYWRESDQTLQFVKNTDAVIPNITGITMASASSQYIKTTTGASIPAAFSVELWVKASAAGGLFDFSAPQVAGTTTASICQAQVTAGGEVEFSLYNGSTWANVTTSGAQVLDGTWHHVVCAYASGTGTVFVDGVNTSNGTTIWTNAAMGTPASTTGYWHFGFVGGIAGAPLTANTYNSFSMARIALYNSALTALQAAAHLQAFCNLGETFYDQEVAYDSATNFWELDEPSGTTAADSIGSNTGTYVNAPSLNQVSPSITVLGTPAIAWPYNAVFALHQQSLRNRIPLSNGGLTASTATSGSSSSGGSSGGYSGGGGRGGGGGCFTGDTLVKTQRGDIRIDEITIGDKCLTAKGNWRPVIAVHKHEAEPRDLHVMPQGAVTHNHKILVDGIWIKAGEVFNEILETNEPVYTLSMFSREPLELSLTPNTERSFTLSNGVVATNVIINKF